MTIEELALNNQTVYGEKYQVKASKKIKDTEAAKPWFSLTESAHVEEKEFKWGTGRSVCFMLKGGGRHYEILSSQSKLQVGEVVDLDKISYVHLHRTGEDKLRVDVLD